MQEEQGSRDRRNEARVEKLLERHHFRIHVWQELFLLREKSAVWRARDQALLRGHFNLQVHPRKFGIRVLRQVIAGKAGRSLGRGLQQVLQVNQPKNQARSR